MDCNRYFRELLIKRELDDPLSEILGSNIDDLINGEIYACDVDTLLNGDVYTYDKCKLPKLFDVTFFDEILERELPPEKWLVDGLIPETGLHLLIGVGKIGKSLLTLQCAQGIALGGLVLGKIPVCKNKVLYISLEERWQLLLKRARTLNFTKTGNNLMVVENINRYNTSDVVNTLDQMLELDPSIKFIVIDTIQLFLNVAELNEYRMSFYSIQALKAITEKRQVSILMVNHKNYNGHNESVDFMQRSLERMGITAACDTLIYLTNLRDGRLADMHVRGREVMGNVYTLKMEEDCGWVLEGDKREVVEGDTQKLIANWIKKYGEAKPVDIYNGLKAEGYMGTSDTIRQTCHRMKNAGKLVNVTGKFCLFTPPVTPVTMSQLELKIK